MIDLGDATLLPGFIDAHTHLTMPYSEDYARAALDGLRKPIPEMALDASVNARITLMAGFTTVRDVGSRDYLDAGLRNAIDRGVVPGPRMLVAVHAIGATGGHCDETGYREGALGPETGPQVGVVNGADEARRAVRLAHKYGATVIKTCATGGVLSLGRRGGYAATYASRTGRAGGRSARAAAENRGARAWSRRCQARHSRGN